MKYLVIETVGQIYVYEVEANNPTEAETKVRMGDGKPKCTREMKPTYSALIPTYSQG